MEDRTDLEIQKFVRSLDDATKWGIILLNPDGTKISLGTVNLSTGATGVLPVANGGTGISSFGSGIATLLETPSSANLAAALTDETGSGSAVFATSPTLVTPTLGVATASQIQFSSTPSDGSFIGIPFIYTAGENLVRGDVCYVKPADGKLWKASATTIATAPCVAIALATINADATGLFGHSGILRDDTRYPALTVNGLLYLATTAGTITQTLPAATNNVDQVLGIALSTHSIIFNPSYSIVEHS